MLTWKAFGGYNHQACCGSPAFCLQHALLQYAQDQQSLQEKAPHGTLALGLKSAIYLSCLCCEIPTSLL